MAWVRKTNINDMEESEIPEGWMRCDGSVIPEPSIWAGRMTPDLNGEKRFLRGGSDNDMLREEL